MIYRRERPRCRKLILTLLKEEDLTLEQLLNHPTIFLSDGLRKQSRKMLEEGQFRTGLDLLRDKRREYFQRSLGMIR